MSEIKHRLSKLRDPPEFGLDYALDDRRQPEQVTLFERDHENVYERWLTADLDIAVDVEDIP